MIRDCAYETHLGLLTDSHRVVKFTAIVTGQGSVSRIHCYNFMNKISLYLVLFLILLVLFLPLLLILRRHLLTLITLLHIWPWTIPISVRLGDPTWWWLLPSERRSDWSLRLEHLRLMRWPERLRLVWWPETILLPQRPRFLWLPNPSPPSSITDCLSASTKVSRDPPCPNISREAQSRRLIHNPLVPSHRKKSSGLISLLLTRSLLTHTRWPPLIS
jgi:hypothetical protein